MSSRHLLAEITAIHGTWCTANFFGNKTFLFVKIEAEFFTQTYDSRSRKEHRGHVISNARGPRHGSCANPCQLIEK